MKTRVIIVRHGEAQGNIERYFQGWTDGKLSSKGHSQAEFAAQRLKNEKIDVIYSSPLSRTMDTASYIAKEHELELNLRDDLREIHGGDWENVLFSELPIKWPEEYQLWSFEPHKHVMPNGESLRDLYERIQAAILDIIQNHLGQNICIVTHGTAIRTLMCYLLNIPFEQLNDVPWYENTAITIFSFDDGKIVVELEGDISHLKQDMCTLGNQDWYEEYTNYIKEKRKND